MKEIRIVREEGWSVDVARYSLRNSLALGKQEGSVPSRLLSRGVRQDANKVAE